MSIIGGSLISAFLQMVSMADPGWGIWGKCPPPPPPPSPFGGTILLIKILNFMSGLDQLTHENVQILVAFINSPEIKANQSQTNCEIAPSTFVRTKRL